MDGARYRRPKRAGKYYNQKYKLYRNWLQEDDKCGFCGFPEREDLGKFFTSSNTYSAHQYCLFSGAGLTQNGKDHEGYDGYLPDDITSLVYKARNVCKGCGVTGATSGCAVRSCSKMYHYPCAIEDGAILQFYGCFDLYCAEHRPLQVLVQLSDRVQPVETDCVICKESLHVNSRKTMVAPCCKCFFHRECVQASALASGSHCFRCPACNEKKSFVREMEIFGIFIPERDPLWENDNLYQFDEGYYLTCQEMTCVCPKGRQYSVHESMWDIIVCKFCGGAGSHLGCMKAATSESDVERYACYDCRVARTPENQRGIRSELEREKEMSPLRATDSEVFQENVHDAPVSTPPPLRHVSSNGSPTHNIMQLINLLRSSQAFLGRVLDNFAAAIDKGRRKSSDSDVSTSDVENQETEAIDSGFTSDVDETLVASDQNSSWWYFQRTNLFQGRFGQTEVSLRIQEVLTRRKSFPLASTESDVNRSKNCALMENQKQQYTARSLLTSLLSPLRCDLFNRLIFNKRPGTDNRTIIIDSSNDNNGSNDNKHDDDQATNGTPRKQSERLRCGVGIKRKMLEYSPSRKKKIRSET